MSAITPNRDQFAALAAAAAQDGGPVVMLNLLKFKDGEGSREYGKYGDSASKMVEALGGRVIYVGRCDQVLIGDAAEGWDAIALVEYPSRQAFIEMVSRKDYQSAHEHREAGLERTVLLATTPTARGAA
jgi:uncharacterized protein (DUF1330 family)